MPNPPAANENNSNALCQIEGVAAISNRIKNDGLGQFDNLEVIKFYFRPGLARIIIRHEPNTAIRQG